MKEGRDTVNKKKHVKIQRSMQDTKKQTERNENNYCCIVKLSHIQYPQLQTTTHPLTAPNKNHT
jgi:hypothetical protein